MANNNGNSTGVSKRALALVAFSTIVGSTGGPLFLVKFGGPTVFRPDPYTSVMADAAHAGLDKRIVRLEQHVENHPDGELRKAISLVVADVAEGKAERRLIIQNQNRILDRLDRIK